MKILVTGCAGFIGYHTTMKLCSNEHDVLGIDNLNSYYDVSLKLARLNKIRRTYSNCFSFDEIDFFKSPIRLKKAVDDVKPEIIIHLGAQAGVRHSIEHPQDYIDNNITGFLNILECCRKHKVKKLLYASSSSVYGHHEDMPFNEMQACNIPANLYAVTKKCNEGMAYVYKSLYGIDSIGLRFFTVYGPWGRPDMALFKFTKNIIEGKPIDVYNHGDMGRDFTYIDDIVDGIEKLLESSCVSNGVFNIGCGQPTTLLSFVWEIQQKLGKPARINRMPMQPGDIKETYCDTILLERQIGYKPKTTIKEGVSNFVDWYVEYYGVKY